MALNTSHANNGVLLHAGESILLFCDDVNVKFAGQADPAFAGEKKGRLYLTTHRMIFNAKKQDAPMKSFSFPFVALKDVELEQPIFGANYIKGIVRAQPNGNYVGEVKFQVHFKSGGAIDFGTAMLRAAQMASSNYRNDTPPPYMPPSGPWYAAPPPAYSPNPGGYMGWVPPKNVFPDQPPANSVFMTDAPPPYPGINGYNGYASASGNFQNQPNPSAPSSADAKAAEAAASSAPPQTQSGWYDPNNPHTVYLPAQNEQPPSYDYATKKND